MTKKVNLHSPPLFEVILPMTESADELIAIQEAFKEITSLIITLVASNVEATAKEMQKMYIFYSILAFGLGIIIGRRI